MTTVSVLTSTYNRSHTLDRLYESLCSQQNQEFEWVIIDDGSTDNTAYKINEYLNIANFKIVAHYQKNSGKHVALNNGVRLCSGNYIFIVDSDDAICDYAINEIVKNIKEHPGFTGYCYRKSYFSGETIGSSYRKEIFVSTPQKAAALFKADLAYVFLKEVMVATPFPVVPGECFVPEGLVWGKIGEKGAILYFPETVIYLCEYLPDGYSRNFWRSLKKSPRGFSLFYRYDIITGRGLVRKAKSLIRLVQCYCIILQKKFNFTFFKNKKKTKLRPVAIKERVLSTSADRLMMILPHAEHGGMARVAATLAEAFSESHQVMVVLLISNMEINFKFRGKILTLCPQGRGSISKFLRFFHRYYLLRKSIKNNKPKYVISFGVTANVLSILTSKNIPVIITEHNIKSVENSSQGFWGRMYSILMRLTYKKAQKVIVLTEAMRRDLLDNFNVPAGNITIIPNPHDFNKIRQDASSSIPGKYEALYQGRVVVAVGNTSWVKAHQHIIRILPDLIDGDSAINLVILGSPADQQKDLERLVVDLNLQNHVHFLGFQENPFPFIARAKLLVLCSLREGLPNVLIEAMALGIPVVASDCVSGPREILAPSFKEARLQGEMYPVFGEYGILTRDFEKGSPCAPGPLSIPEKDFLNAIKTIMTTESLWFDYRQKSLQGVKRFNPVQIASLYQKEFKSCERIT